MRGSWLAQKVRCHNRAVLIVHNCGVILLEPAGSNYIELADLRGDTATPEGLRQILSEVTRIRSYRAEPITLLLATRDQFTYARAYSGIAVMPQLGDDNFYNIQSIGHVRSGRIAVLQGVRQGQLDVIRDCLDAVKLSVIEIMTLPAHALSTRGWEGVQRGTVVRVGYGRNCTVVFGTSESGGVVHSVTWNDRSSVDQSSDIGCALCEVLRDEFKPSLVESVSSESTRQTVKEKGRGLAKRPREIVWEGQASWPTAGFRWVLLLSMVKAYARRTAMVAAPLAVGFWGLGLWGHAVADGALRNALAQDDVKVERGQLQNAIDSLRQEASVRNRIPAYRFGPLISLFCQRSWSGVQLKGLSAQLTATDTLIFTAEGVATQAAQVLDMKTYLDSCVLPWSFSCDRLRPVGVAKPDGRMDTVTSFALRLVVSHD